jgi:hypothetical protein
MELQLPLRVSPDGTVFLDPWFREAAQGLGNMFADVYSKRDEDYYLIREISVVHPRQSRGNGFEELPISVEQVEISVLVPGSATSVLMGRHGNRLRILENTYGVRIRIVEVTHTLKRTSAGGFKNSSEPCTSMRKLILIGTSTMAHLVEIIIWSRLLKSINRLTERVGRKKKKGKAMPKPIKVLLCDTLVFRELLVPAVPAPPCPDGLYSPPRLPGLSPCFLVCHQ